MDAPLVSLAGRRALVTGAASGIGRAVALELRRCGAEVVASDVSADGLAALAREVPGLRACASDLATRDGVNALLAAAGDVDVLVNNAGFQHVSPLHELDERKWDQLLALMLTAPFLLIRGLIPGMYRRGWGRVINVGSVHSLIASANKAAYVAAKHGLLGLTRVAALEAAARCPQVTVNALCPSYVRTPLVENQIAAQAKVHGIPPSEVIERVLLDRNAAKRLIEPEEVARYATFLCRDDAWSTTGATVTMDAGWLAH